MGGILGAEGWEYRLASGAFQESARRFVGGASILSPDDLFEGPEMMASEEGVKERSGGGRSGDILTCMEPVHGGMEWGLVKIGSDPSPHPSSQSTKPTWLC